MSKFIIASVMLSILAGCKNVQYIPVETVKTEYRDNIRRDSIHITDSVFMFIKGDTVVKEKYIRIYVDKAVSDSVIIRDSINVPVPVIKYIEVNKKTFIDKILQGIGIITLILLAVTGVILGIKRKLKKLKL